MPQIGSFFWLTAPRYTQASGYQDPYTKHSMVDISFNGAFIFFLPKIEISVWGHGLEKSSTFGHVRQDCSPR